MHAKGGLPALRHSLACVSVHLFLCAVPRSPLRANIDAGDFNNFLRTIQNNLRPYDLDIRLGMSETLPESGRYLVLVTLAADELSNMACLLNTRLELPLFNQIVSMCLRSANGVVSRSAVRELRLEPGFQQFSGDQLASALDGLVRGGWIEPVPQAVDEVLFTLSVRARMELVDFLTASAGDRMCGTCRELVVFGFGCMHEGCGALYHSSCIEAMPGAKCPRCLSVVPRTFRGEADGQQQPDTQSAPATRAPELEPETRASVDGDRQHSKRKRRGASTRAAADDDDNNGDDGGGSSGGGDGGGGDSSGENANVRAGKKTPKRRRK